MVRTWIHQVPFRWEKSNCRSIWITKQRAQSRNTSVKAPLPQTFLDCKSAGNSVPQKRFRVKQLSQSHSKYKSSHWEVRETPQEKNHSEIQFAILNLNLKYIYIFFFLAFFWKCQEKGKKQVPLHRFTFVKCRHLRHETQMLLSPFHHRSRET